MQRMHGSSMTLQYSTAASHARTAASHVPHPHRPIVGCADHARHAAAGGVHTMRPTAVVCVGVTLGVCSAAAGVCRG
eukprot:1138699-Pelagomonas_calceolata.AAC.2